MVDEMKNLEIKNNLSYKLFYLPMFLFFCINLNANTKMNDVNFNAYNFSYIENNQLYIAGNLTNYRKFLGKIDNNCYVKFIVCSTDHYKLNLKEKIIAAEHTLWGTYLLNSDNALFAIDEIRPYTPSIYWKKKPKQRSFVNIQNNVEKIKSNDNVLAILTKKNDLYILGNANKEAIINPKFFFKLNFKPKDLFISDKNIFIIDPNNNLYSINISKANKIKFEEKIKGFKKFINTNENDGIIYLAKNNKIQCQQCSVKYKKYLKALQSLIIKESNKLITKVIANKNGLAVLFENKVIFNTKGKVFYRNYEN